MTKPKNPEPNPIEKAIGDRAKPKNPSMNNISPEQIPDVPSPSEMLTLEELNRQTEERLLDKPVEDIPPMSSMAMIATPKSPIPALKPDPQPATKTCSPESPPQKINYWCPTCKIDLLNKESLIAHVCPTPVIEKEFTEMAFQAPIVNSPAEDIELTALRKYILEDGFVVATVAFHIVSLCAQPMTTPSTTMWDFKDRASIPDMVLALLNQPGYLEGIWPSLKIVMSSNAGNAAWCAGIATTIAFFDVIRTLPALKELQNGTEKKS